MTQNWFDLWNEKKKTAFSLTEIVVTLALIGILFGLAVPSWQRAQEHQKLIEAVEQVELRLHESFSTARNLNQPTQFLVSERGNDFYSLITESSQRIFLPSGVTFATEANFQFVPPYGDIDPIPKHTEVWLQNNHQKTGLKLYPKSGLIERLPVEIVGSNIP